MRLDRSGWLDIGDFRARLWRYIYPAYAYAGTKTGMRSGIWNSWKYACHDVIDLEVISMLVGHKFW
jgi:hypothetical protein